MSLVGWAAQAASKNLSCLNSTVSLLKLCFKETFWALSLRVCQADLSHAPWHWAPSSSELSSPHLSVTWFDCLLSWILHKPGVSFSVCRAWPSECLAHIKHSANAGWIKACDVQFWDSSFKWNLAKLGCVQRRMARKVVSLKVISCGDLGDPGMTSLEKWRWMGSQTSFFQTLEVDWWLSCCCRCWYICGEEKMGSKVGKWQQGKAAL